MTYVSRGARIGFVGLGRMGRPMSGLLAQAGHRMVGFDLDAAAREEFAAATGGEAVTAVADCARGAEAVILMLPSSAVVDAVLTREGLLAALAPGTLLIDMSSSEPLETRRLAQLAGEQGVRMLDAPVSGGVAGAAAGSLTIMVGGGAADYEAALPLLEVLGGSVRHVGEAGAGHALKALNNLLSATSLLVSCEAVLAARRFGLDPVVAVDVFNGASGRSWSTQNKLPNFILPETFDSGFALGLMLKDMRIAADLARSAGAPSVLGERAIEGWEQAAESLPADADHTEIARWVSARAEGSDA